MLPSRLKNERRIFFPWEGRAGLRRFLALGRFGPALFFLVCALIVVSIVSRERRAAGERKTRVALSAVRPAVENYLLDSEGECPADLDSVKSYLPRGELPSDGWGQPLRIVCPSAREGVDFVLMSDGPDGAPGGLDRIEY